MTLMLALNQSVFCACSMDILEYTVKEIRHSDSGAFYVLRSKRGVGQHRFIEILVAQGESQLRYIELIHTEKGDCEFGLETFTHGTYHTTIEAAKIQYSRNQINLLKDRQSQLKRELVDVQARIDRWSVICPADSVLL